MNDKLSQWIREVEDEGAGEVQARSLEAHRQRERDRALLIVGGFNTATRIAQVISSEIMRGLEIFQNEKIYLALEFDTFVEYLSSDLSPLTKPQYYQRKALLDKEGDPLFDLYGEIGLSSRKRKLLGKGMVELEGETVLVKNGDEEIEIALSDRTRLLETLSALADANADKSAKLEKQKTAIAGHDEKVKKFYAEIDQVKASKAVEAGNDPHTLAIVNLNFAYRSLIEAVEAMTEVEKQQFATRDFELIAFLKTNLAAAYGRTDWTKITRSGSPPFKGGVAAASADGVVAAEGVDDIDDLINRALDDDDSNDAELAQSL